MKSLFLVAALLFTMNASATLINYEVELVSDTDSLAFGGSTADTSFVGTFSIDDSLVGTPTPIGDPGLTGSVLFFSFNIGGTLFTDSNVVNADNALRFAGGPLLDIVFQLELATGETLSIFTAFEGFAEWSAEDVDNNLVGGDTFPTSVRFTEVPEPSILMLLSLGLLGIFNLRKTQKTI